MIYLDSAATSYYRPREVAQAVYDAILTMGNAGRGSHASSLNSARMIYETRCLLNELFHGPGPEQVVFTSNATEALNIAIQGLTAPGVRMAATAMDHNSVLRPVYRAKERGCSLQILDVDEKGRLSLEICLAYLNTSSVRVLMDMLDILEEAHQGGRGVEVVWLYNENNERVGELAEEFKEDCTFPFHIRAE